LLYHKKPSGNSQVFRGSKSKSYKYFGSNDLNAVAWSKNNANKTQIVASK